MYVRVSTQNVVSHLPFFMYYTFTKNTTTKEYVVDVQKPTFLGHCFNDNRWTITKKKNNFLLVIDFMVDVQLSIQKYIVFKFFMVRRTPRFYHVFIW